MHDVLRLACIQEKKCGYHEERRNDREKGKKDRAERCRSAEENLEVISCRYIDTFITVIILCVTFGTERENA